MGRFKNSDHERDLYWLAAILGFDTQNQPTNSLSKLCSAPSFAENTLVNPHCHTAATTHLQMRTLGHQIESQAGLKNPSSYSVKCK